MGPNPLGVIWSGILALLALIVLPAALAAQSTSINESSVVGLISGLGVRPIHGPGFVAGRVVVTDSNGMLESAVGAATDCVYTNGSTGPCVTDATFVVVDATFVDAEIPTGTVDGTNAAFTLSQAASPASSLQLYRNGILQQAGNDFSVSGTAIIFLQASIPQVGDVVQAFYRVGTAESLTSQSRGALLPASGAAAGPRPPSPPAGPSAIGGPITGAPRLRSDPDKSLVGGKKFCAIIVEPPGTASDAGALRMGDKLCFVVVGPGNLAGDSPAHQQMSVAAAPSTNAAAQAPPVAESGPPATTSGTQKANPSLLDRYDRATNIAGAQLREWASLDSEPEARVDHAVQRPRSLEILQQRLAAARFDRALILDASPDLPRSANDSPARTARSLELLRRRLGHAADPTLREGRRPTARYSDTDGSRPNATRP